jgi:hypothetical protein
LAGRDSKGLVDLDDNLRSTGSFRTLVHVTSDQV